METLSRTGNRLSLVRLATFLVAAALLVTGFIQKSALELGLGTVCLALFGVAVVLHARTITAETRARIRRDIHGRSLARIGHEWVQFASKGADLLPRSHAYAWDIDIVGHGSLFQRIDVTHTHHGERTLAAWLASPADLATIRARQEAVWELAPQVELRREIEAAASTENGERLDPRGLEALGNVDRLFERLPWLQVVIVLLPMCTLVTYILGLLDLIANGWWLIPVAIQVLLLFSFGRTIQNTLNIVSARAPLLTAFESMLLLLERTPFKSPWLLELQKRVTFAEQPPSTHIRRLARWAGFAELRQNALFYIFVNALTLWDLHVLHGLERFVREAGTRMTEWFEALGELEAIAALAALAHLDEGATRPELGDEQPFEATAIAHPLLTPETRVANDVRLRGAGTALVVTGSNMAGKSTLLRSVGQNIALALAGGPVIAEHMRVPSVRLRASMRADDSLESGASYFHAELTKLTRVIEQAEVGPPVFFLLDELLRGTNARARHVGAKAVLLHLLDRGATGLCATHDVELAALGDTEPARIENVHFTDVVIDGEMRFDYKLRPGIVRTSNALRLLQMAGIHVPEQDRQDQQQAPPLPVREVGEGAR